MINLYETEQKPAALPPKKPGAKKPSYKQYEDVTGEFTAKELKYSLWYVSHKVMLRKLTLIFLISFSAVTLSYSLWQFGDYVLYGYSQDKILEQQAAQFYDYTGIHSRYAPAPLNIVSTAYLQGGVDKFDVLAEVSNSNNFFIAKFSYHFIVDGALTPPQNTVFLPGENRPVAYFGLDGNGASSIRLVIDNIAWKRVSTKQVANPRNWQENRLNFSIDKFMLTPAGLTPLSANANVIEFDYTNNSPYGYDHPKFYVALYANGGLSAILPLELNRFESLSAKHIDLRSFVVNLEASEARIFPLINVYDDAVYLPPPR